eukprot:GEZU01004151.1.p1 GENE.GEZU01004151.1~~GEZU01004151.1.p1  ORF type:complete len:347 (+),score=137.27 GEZU01004151.1:351-1391(+)
MCDKLIVGVHSDADILRHKGPPVMREDERYEAVRGCKWADEVVEGAPYVTQLSMLDQYGVDYCLHGEDITTDENGVDCYDEIKKAGRFKYIKRTEGVSTTDIVGRMLLMTKDHFKDSADKIVNGEGANKGEVTVKDFQSTHDARSPYTGVSHFLPTTRKISQFSNNREPKPGDKIVYVDGGFDLFHTGHINFLQKARELGDFLYVGIHDDRTVNTHKGGNYPIMNLHERVLSVLSCRYVDEVIIGAPFVVDKELIDSLKINLVVHGSVPDIPNKDDIDPYEVPKKLGIFKEIPSPRPYLTTKTVVERIIKNRMLFEERNKKKEQKELKYLEAAIKRGDVPEAPQMQ